MPKPLPFVCMRQSLLPGRLTLYAGSLTASLILGLPSQNLSCQSYAEGNFSTTQHSNKTRQAETSSEEAGKGRALTSKQCVSTTQRILTFIITG